MYRSLKPSFAMFSLQVDLEIRMQFTAPTPECQGCSLRTLMMLAAVHPGSCFSGSCSTVRSSFRGPFLEEVIRVLLFAGRIFAPAAGRSVRRSRGGHFVSCLDRQSLKLSTCEV